MQLTIKWGLKHILATFCCVMSILLIAAGLSRAQEPGKQDKEAISHGLQEWRIIATSPGVKVVSQQYQHPGKVLSAGQNPQDIAYDWLVEKGLEEGRNFIDGKLLYVSIGTASINAKPSDPGYIDSRYLAFQRAELSAKAKTAIFLGVDLSTEKGCSEREINPKERAEIERIVEASPVLQENAEKFGIKDRIYNLFDKAYRVADTKMDQVLEESGVDVATGKAKEKQKIKAKQAKRDRLSRLRNIGEVSLKAAASAFADVQGTQVIQSLEGSYHDNYQAVVITLWSKNIQKLVESMQRGTAPWRLPLKKAKQEVSHQLPQDANELACLTGVRAYINQDGQHVLLAFGQSGVTVTGRRKDKAFELSGKKARMRAMAAMRGFMGEKIAFSGSEDLMEVLALYADEYQNSTDAAEYRSISQFQERIIAVAEQQKIRGMHGLVTKELTHPFTDRPLVLKVMSWSPSSQAMSLELKRTIEQGVDKPEPPKPAERTQEQVPARKGVISSGEGADKDAW